MSEVNCHNGYLPQKYKNGQESTQMFVTPRPRKRVAGLNGWVALFKINGLGAKTGPNNSIWGYQSGLLEPPLQHLHSTCSSRLRSGHKAERERHGQCCSRTKQGRAGLSCQPFPTSAVIVWSRICTQDTRISQPTMERFTCRSCWRQ